MRSFERSITELARKTGAATAPTIRLAHGSMTSQPAVIDTSPESSAPVAAMMSRRRPLEDTSDIVTIAIVDDEAARTVAIALAAAACRCDCDAIPSVEPGLNPNHPTKSSNAPVMTDGMLFGTKLDCIARSHLPMRGPTA